ITFSYAIGSYSSRRGLLVGLLFSLAFTLQRAIASELAGLALGRVLRIPALDAAVYVVVGVTMVVAGAYVRRSGRLLHLHLRRPLRRPHAAPAVSATQPRALRPWMALVHGFIAGWGFGAFALTLYTTLAPAMPSPWLAWVPGAVFGLGTTTVQGAAGAAFGAVSRHLRLPGSVATRIAQTTAGRTLWWGGWLFTAAGLFALALPRLAGLSVATGVGVPNLDRIGLPLVLVMTSVLGIGVGGLVTEVRRAVREAPSEPGPPSVDLPSQP
ncbi:MAG TPA: hypothetical protein VMW49_02315, partial [Candidatus Dormibacteraeota bacterium]|nr:hypothetical protein [Candidatus Dormibacteraeota bacterium]